MKSETAKKVVEVRLPGYRMAAAGRKLDARRRKPEIEESSPALEVLKERFFKSRDSVPAVKSPSADSGILVVEKESTKSKASAPRAVIVNKGRIVGRQG